MLENKYDYKISKADKMAMCIIIFQKIAMNLKKQL